MHVDLVRRGLVRLGDRWAVGVMAVAAEDGFLARLSAFRSTPEARPAALEEVRFAFYGRMSTSTFQDVQTSRAWQRAVSDELIEGIGSVVAEFFDAVVVGEYERAFHGDQFREVVSRLNALGVAVWLPEAGGPVELGSAVHEALMVLLGAQAQRRVARVRQRVLAAMRAQTRVQGRFLGGRPPYGYRLVDGGRHPIRCMVDGVGGCRCWHRIR